MGASRVWLTHDRSTMFARLGRRTAASVAASDHRENLPKTSPENLPYALVISISAAGQAVDLHAEVANLVQVKEVEALIG